MLYTNWPSTGNSFEGAFGGYGDVKGNISSAAGLIDIGAVDAESNLTVSGGYSQGAGGAFKTKFTGNSSALLDLSEDLSLDGGLQLDIDASFVARINESFGG